MTKILLLLLLVFLPPAQKPETQTQTGWLTLQHLGADTWLVTDELPPTIHPEMVTDLFSYLDGHIDMQEISPLFAVEEDIPRVICFVPQNDLLLLFPLGTEGFAGLSDRAYWQCNDSSDMRSCSLSSNPDYGDMILLASVVVQDDPRMSAGYLIHETAHLLGAIDGERCPTHDEYNPTLKRPPDCQDAYWWYGVTGYFDLRPSGIAWKAMTGQCSISSKPEICYDLEQLLADVSQQETPDN